MSRIFMVAGEVSGDTHAVGLMGVLRALDPAIQFAGLGGPQMRKLGGSQVEDWVEKAGVVGLWEVIKVYRYFREKFDKTLATIDKFAPDALILVDYPGFNLRLASALRRRGFKGRIIYYISPQVWAWKRGRVKTMAKVLDLMICIFPFEQAFYEESGLRAVFAGHPLVDRMQERRRAAAREPGLVGWFPGSRMNEVKRIFPILLEASRRIAAAQPGARFAVSAANERLADCMRQMAAAQGRPEAAKWIETGTVYDLMQRAEVGAVASGTATLEAACLGLPYALVYHVNWLTYVAGKALVRIPFLGILNILAGREVVREFIQQDLTPGNLAAEMLSLLQDADRRAALSRQMAATVATLGEGGAYERAARVVMDELRAT